MVSLSDSAEEAAEALLLYHLALSSRQEWRIGRVQCRLTEQLTVTASNSWEHGHTSIDVMLGVVKIYNILRLELKWSLTKPTHFLCSLGTRFPNVWKQGACCLKASSASKPLVAIA